VNKHKAPAWDEAMQEKKYYGFVNGVWLMQYIARDVYVYAPTQCTYQAQLYAPQSAQKLDHKTIVCGDCNSYYPMRRGLFIRHMC